ncbi:MAG: hypothetical protein M3440_13370 [Chloroflexota bacterium]|nr:hypothetical protein [Chloroflexota bacterium]
MPRPPLPTIGADSFGLWGTKNNALWTDAHASLDRVDPGSVNVLAGGTVTGNGTTDDTAALAAKVAVGGHIFIPKPPGPRYRITGPIPVPPGTHITIDPNAIIRQETKYKPVFDALNADDVVIEGGRYEYVGDRSWTDVSSFRGENIYTYSAAVWSNGSRCRFRKLRGFGFTCVVMLSGWNGTALTNYYGDKNVVDEIDVDTIDFGVLFQGQSNLTVDNVRGTAVQSPSGPGGSHLVYGSDGARNRNVNGDSWLAHDCLTGHAVQLKGITGGTVTNIVENNCSGSLSLRDVTDMHLDVVSINDQGLTGQGSLFIQDGISGCHRNVIDASLNMGASTRAARIAGSANRINLDVRSRHPATSDEYDIDIDTTAFGCDVTYSLRNTQDDGADYTTGRRGVLFRGTDNVLRPGVSRNARIDIEAVGTTNCTIDLTHFRSKLASVGGLFPLLLTSFGGRVIWPFGRRALSATTAISEFDEVLEVDVTAAWHAMNLPTAASTPGRRLTFTKTDASANGVQIVPNGTNTIVGPSIAASSTTPLLITSRYGFVTILSNGTVWRIIAMGGTVTT